MSSIFPCLCEDFLQFVDESVDGALSPETEEHNWESCVVALDHLHPKAVPVLSSPFHMNCRADRFHISVGGSSKTKVYGIVGCFCSFLFEAPDRGVNKDVSAKGCHVAWNVLLCFPVR